MKGIRLCCLKWFTCNCKIWFLYRQNHDTNKGLNSQGAIDAASSGPKLFKFRVILKWFPGRVACFWQAPNERNHFWLAVRLQQIKSWVHQNHGKHLHHQIFLKQKLFVPWQEKKVYKVNEFWRCISWLSSSFDRCCTRLQICMLSRSHQVGSFWPEYNIHGRC